MFGGLHGPKIDTGRSSERPAVESRCAERISGGGVGW